MLKQFFAKSVMAAVIFSAVLFTNCESLRSAFREPVVSLRSVELAKLSFTGIQLLCKVNVENPNAFDIPFPDTDWEFFVNTNSFVKGAVNTGQSIRARGTTVVEVPVSFEYLQVFNTFSSLIGADEANYKVALDVKFTFPILGDMVFNFQHEGVFPLLKIPTISFAGIRVRNVSLTAIDFEINWEVENNNSFAMNVKDLSYSFAVNNSQWTSGRVPGSPQIAAKGKTQIPIVFSINGLAMVRDITEIITRGTGAAYSCSGNISLGALFPGLDDFNYPFNFTGSTALR
jgi:LEA14-like dessication related protein